MTPTLIFISTTTTVDGSEIRLTTVWMVLKPPPVNNGDFYYRVSWSRISGWTINSRKWGLPSPTKNPLNPNRCCCCCCCCWNRSVRLWCLHWSIVTMVVPWLGRIDFFFRWCEWAAGSKKKNQHFQWKDGDVLYHPVVDWCGVCFDWIIPWHLFSDLLYQNSATKPLHSFFFSIFLVAGKNGDPNFQSLFFEGNSKKHGVIFCICG